MKIDIFTLKPTVLSQAFNHKLNNYNVNIFQWTPVVGMRHKGINKLKDK